MDLPKTLVEGHLRFRRDEHAKKRGRYLQLAELGQAPTAMVIACCDARVDVSTIFDAEPGALFIMRNVANLVPPYEPEGEISRHQRGHRICRAGAEGAASHRARPLALRRRRRLPPKVRDKSLSTASSAVGSRCSTISRSVESDIFKYRRRAGLRVRRHQLIDGQSRTFPFIQKRKKEGLLTLHGLHFDLAQRRAAGAREAKAASRNRMQPRRRSPRGKLRWQALQARSAPRVRLPMSR